MGTLSFSRPRPLSEADDLEGFFCGVGIVDDWLARHARNARRLGTAVVYASFCEKDGERLAGFYLLSSHSIVRDSTSGWISRNAPEVVPVILLGMLGVDRCYQGMGLGHNLLLDAGHRAASVAGIVGARALVVDPVDETSRSFYRRHGFRDMPGTGKMHATLSF